MMAHLILSIVLFLAMVICLAFLAEDLSFSLGWKKNISNVFWAILAWPFYLIILLFSGSNWERIAALVAWLGLIVYVQWIYGIAFYWQIIATGVWLLIFFIIVCLVYGLKKDQIFFSAR